VFFKLTILSLQQGVAYVKHLLDQAIAKLRFTSAPASVQQVVLANQCASTDLRVDLLSSRLTRLETASDLSDAIFAEEQDGRINEE